MNEGKPKGIKVEEIDFENTATPVDIDLSEGIAAQEAAVEARRQAETDAAARRVVDEATLKAVQERLQMVDPNNDNGEGRIDQRPYQTSEKAGTGTGKEDVVTVEKPANEAEKQDVGAAVARVLNIEEALAAQDAREKVAAKIFAFRQNPNAPPPDESEEDEQKAASG